MSLFCLSFECFGDFGVEGGYSCRAGSGFVWNVRWGLRGFEEDSCLFRVALMV